MTEVIDFKTKRLIRNFKSTKKDKKQRAIAFLKDIIKLFEEDKIDPEKCIVLAKWSLNSDEEMYQYYNNDITVESMLSLMEFCKHKYLQDFK